MIDHHLSLKIKEPFDGEIKLDESYFVMILSTLE